MGSERIPLRRSSPEAKSFEYDWDEIQGIVEPELDDRTRELIETVTSAFGIFGDIQADDNSILVSEFLPALTSWTRATDNLRRTLRLEVNSAEKKFGRADVILPFLERDVESFGRILPLELLGLTVSSATAACQVVHDEIEAAGSRIKNDLWSVWVCLVAIYLTRGGVKVTASSGSKKESPFVRVIQSLNSCLPVGCQRFSESGDSYESVANGIKLARRTLGKLSEKELLLILAGWGSGILKGYQGPLETSGEAEIAEFEARAERVFADIGRRAAGAAAGSDPTSTSALLGNGALAEDTKAATEEGFDPTGIGGTPQDKVSGNF